MTRTPDISSLPKPRPERAGGRKLAVFALLVLLLAGSAAFWLTRDEETRQAYKERLAHWLADTPLAPLATWMQPAPPPPPERVVNPTTQPGTLAGQAVQGSVPALPDPALPPEGKEGEGQEATPPETPPVVAPPVTEDNVVRPLFVEDVARWLTARFHPAKDGGSLQVGVQAMNLRFGGQMPGLTRPESASRDISSRAAVLRYAFNPPMLTALYELYVERFLEALRAAAEHPRDGKPLTPTQVDALYKACAGHAAAYAGALRAIGEWEDFNDRMRQAAALLRQAMDMHQQMTEAIFTLDSARESGSQARVEAAQLRASGANAQYQKRLDEYRAAQHALCADLRKASPQAKSLGDDTLIYIAAWMERRLSENPQSRQTALTAARLLDDLAQRLRTAASVAR